MAEKIKFSVSREKLVAEETDDFVLMRVPNSKGQNYVAFEKADIYEATDKIYFFQMDGEKQIAMWNKRPHMQYAVKAQTEPDYVRDYISRLSAGDLYNGYYNYAENTDPAVQRSRTEREKQIVKKAEADAKEEGKETAESETQAETSGDKGKGKKPKKLNKEKAVPEALESPEEEAAEENKTPEQEPPKHFNHKQMAEILKGMLQGVDIMQYRRLGLKAEQMRELRLALKDGIDVSGWNNHNVDAESMRELRRGYRHGMRLDMSKINVSDFKAEQIHELWKGFEQKLDVNQYLDAGYEAAQMRELRLGLRAGLDISAYQSVCFSAEQMRLIRYRLVMFRVIEILKNFLQEAVQWLLRGVEEIADRLSVRTPHPQIDEIMSKLPPEQSPVEQIKDVLAKSEFIDEALLQNEPMNEKLTAYVQDMVLSVASSVLAKEAEDAVLDVTEDMAAAFWSSSLLQTAESIFQTAGVVGIGAVIAENSQFHENSVTVIPEQDQFNKDPAENSPVEGSIKEQTAQYMEAQVATEEAMVMEG